MTPSPTPPSAPPRWHLSSAQRRYLLLPMFTLLLLSSLSVWFWWMSNQALAEAQLSETQVKNQLQMMRQQIKQLGQDSTTIENYLPRYQQLVERGYLQNEQRLDFLEKIRQSQQEKGLFPMEYTLTPQQDWLSATGELKIRASTIELKTSLLHEGDLPLLLHDLRNTPSGWITPFECELTRLPPATTSTAKLSANLNAACKLYWFSVSTGAAPTQPQ